MLQAQIYIDKNEFIQNQSLYEFIMQFLMKYKIKGATAFNGSFGYLNSYHLSRPNDLFSFDEIPLLITFIDETDKVTTVLNAFRKVTAAGYIVVHEVREW